MILLSKKNNKYIMKHNKYNDSDSEFNENMDDELELELDRN